MFEYNGLNCYQTTALIARDNPYLMMVSGMATAPDNNDYGHTWLINMKGEVFDFFKWTNHKPKQMINKPTQLTLNEWSDYLLCNGFPLPHIT